MNDKNKPTDSAKDSPPPKKPSRVRVGFVESMDRGAKMQEIAAAHAGNLSRRSPMPTFIPYKPEAANANAPLAEQDFSGTSGRDIRTLELSKIHPNPFQPREVYTQEALRERAESIRANGQFELIHVIPHPEIPGEFLIGDGWTRTTACIEFNVCSTLSAEVHHDMSPEQAAWLGYEQNEQREQFCDMDRAFFFDKLYAQGTTQKEISKKTGIPQPTLSHYAAFKRLPDEVLDLIRLNGKAFPAYIAPFIARVAEKVSPMKAAGLTLSYSQGAIPTRAFVSLCTDLTSKKVQPSTKKTNKVVRFSNGVLRQKGGKYDLSIEVDEKTREAFNADLDELLKRYATPETVSAAPSDASTDANA